MSPVLASSSLCHFISLESSVTDTISFNILADSSLFLANQILFWTLCNLACRADESNILLLRTEVTQNDTFYSGFRSSVSVWEYGKVPLGDAICSLHASTGTHTSFGTHTHTQIPDSQYAPISMGTHTGFETAHSTASCVLFRKMSCGVYEGLKDSSLSHVF